MNKIERVDRVLNGEEVDRPPLSLWYHFGIHHAGGEQFARIGLEFFNHYDFDFLKVMNDYFLSAAPGSGCSKDQRGFKTHRPLRCRQNRLAGTVQGFEAYQCRAEGQGIFY